MCNPPVSYTHLDVYKRQTIHCSSVGRDDVDLQIFSSCIGKLNIQDIADRIWVYINLSDVISYVAVSYTHLTLREFISADTRNHPLNGYDLHKNNKRGNPLLQDCRK